MSWYNPASWFGIGSQDPTNADRTAIEGNAAQGNSLGQLGQANYAQSQGGMQNAANYLQGQANGQNSVSAMQLQQGLQQGLAQQQSMAAGASPNNAAMAARNAAMNMGQQSTAALGQQAVAGLQERNQANQALGSLYGQMGSLGVNAATGGYGAANQGYGTAIQNPQATWGSFVGPAIAGAAAAGSKAAFSDERLKKDIKTADDDANKSMSLLQAYRFQYKNQEHGTGDQFGIMAQDLEKAGLKHAVIDTPQGKMVHGAKLATANTAMLASLAKRVGELEGK